MAKFCGKEPIAKFFGEKPVKGQLISKGLFGIIVCDHKTKEIFLRISTLASKKSSNQKTLLYKYVK